MSWQLTPKFSQTARSSGGIAIETVYFVLQEMNHDTKYRMMENLFLHLRKCHFFTIYSLVHTHQFRWDNFISNKCFCASKTVGLDKLKGAVNYSFLESQRNFRSY